jgi:hypothetical protein
MTGTEKISNSLGCTFEIIFLNNAKDTINTSFLNTCTYDVDKNIRPWMGNIFDKMLIQVFDYRLSDLPQNKYTCDEISCRVTEYGIRDSLGLTRAWDTTNGISGSIQINSKTCLYDEATAHAVGHELGHDIQYNLGWYDENHPFRKKWNQLRGIHCFDKFFNQLIPPEELMPEDCRLFFGPRYTNGYGRGDYIQANQVKGLKGFYLVWALYNNYVAPVQAAGGLISDIKFFDSDNFNYYAVQFLEEYPSDHSKDKYVWIDINARYDWVYRIIIKNNVPVKEWYWKEIKRF